MTENARAENVIRAAKPDEAVSLSELALRSKGYWGYDEQFLVACRAELTLTSADLAAYPFYVLETKGRIAGFYSLREASALDDAGSEVELNHLYIEPLAIGEGFGKRLWQHACETARRLGFERMAIPADPFAESFYLRMGAVRVGEIASGSIPGRMLPLLHFSLVQPPSAYASDG